LPALTDALLGAGIGDATAAAVMGGSAIGFLARALPG
jgi:hypothetical protein